MKYTLKKKIWCVKQMKLEITNYDISRYRKIPRMTLYRWYNHYCKVDEKDLKEKLKVVKAMLLNKKCMCFIWKNVKNFKIF